MKIVHVISNLANGGAEKFVVELANEQARYHDVSIINFRNIAPWMYPPKKIQEKVILYQLGKKEGFSFLLLIKLIILLRRLDPDIINNHLNSTVKYVYIASFFGLSAKYIQTIHSDLQVDNITFFNALNRLPYFKKRFINVCISESIWNEFRCRYKEMDFRHIDNGIDKMKKTDNFVSVEVQIDELLKQKNRKLFVAIGRFSYEKNFIMLSNLFVKLEQQKKNAVLIIIGGDPDDEEQRIEIEYINEAKGGNTFLVGSKENVGDYLLKADALILSSRFEGMPIVVLEALSTGLPIISTPAGGVKDIIENGINGFIADGFEIENLYQAVLSFLGKRHGELSIIRSNNMKLFKTKFDIGICSQKYILLYKEDMAP